MGTMEHLGRVNCDSQVSHWSCVLLYHVLFHHNSRAFGTEISAVEQRSTPSFTLLYQNRSFIIMFCRLMKGKTSCTCEEPMKREREKDSGEHMEYWSRWDAGSRLLTQPPCEAIHGAVCLSVTSPITSITPATYSGWPETHPALSHRHQTHALNFYYNLIYYYCLFYGYPAVVNNHSPFSPFTLTTLQAIPPSILPAQSHL